jgi:acetone carboxylase, gamma subunit
MNALYQQRVPFDDRIVLPLQENLFVVQSEQGRIVRCGVCGHDFGSYLRNWKESALIYERDPQDGEVYPPANAPTRDWMVAREFYCPGCATLLDTEGVPQGYPFIFNFLPYFEDDEERPA